MNDELYRTLSEAVMAYTEAHLPCTPEEDHDRLYPM